jgi:hypothetical protein
VIGKVRRTWIVVARAANFEKEDVLKKSVPVFKLLILSIVILGHDCNGL